MACHCDSDRRIGFRRLCGDHAEDAAAEGREALHKCIAMFELLANAGVITGSAAEEVERFCLGPAREALRALNGEKGGR